MTGRNRTIALLPIAILLALASCGGESKPSKPSAGERGTTGATQPSTTASKPYRASPTAPRPSTGPSTSNTRGKSKPAANGNGRRGQSGGGAPSLPSPSRGENPSLDQPKRRPDEPKKQSGSSPAVPATPAQPLSKPQEVLARKAKRVCQSLGIDGLSAKYHVEATPAAVAAAYAASYPPTFRSAVEDGCRSAFSAQ